MSSRQDREFTEKRAALEAFLAHGPAMLHLDARHPGVRVPPWLNDDLQLRLRVSLSVADHQNTFLINRVGIPDRSPDHFPVHHFFSSPSI